MTTGTRRPWARAASWLLGALAILAFAACAQGAGTGIPTAGGGEGDTPNATDSARATVDPQDASFEYAQCVRDNGYPEFPDPGPDGGFSLSGGHGAGAHDRDDPRLQAAMEACSQLRPAGLDHQDLGDPEYVEQMLAFSQCMRENGVPDFPDPGPDGQLVIGHGSGIDRNDPRLQAAMEICYESVPGVAH
jgi:hypothetical protein